MERTIFSATNAQNVTYDLMDLHVAALFDQAGLGYEENTSFTQIGNFWLPKSTSLKQPEITGTMMFIGEDSYKKYFDFVRWSRYAPIQIKCVNDAGTFYIDTKVVQIEKAETAHNITGMTCKIVFSALGLWYDNKSMLLQQTEVDALDVYSYTYDFNYGVEPVNYIRVVSDSTQESSAALTIYGYIENPRWSHYVNGELFATGAYAGTVEDGRKLVIDNRTVPYSIAEYNMKNEFLADRYQQCDFSTERFLYIQSGQNVIVVEHDDINNLTFRIDARIEYESV